MIRTYGSCINDSHFTSEELLQLFEMKVMDNDNHYGNISQQDEQYKQLYLQARFATGLVIFPILCLFGLCGNSLSILVLSLKKMRTPTNIYLISLAVADSIKLINDLLYFVSILCLKTNPIMGRTVYATLYPYTHYFFNMSVCCTAWITVSVAVERYILVCHPARAKSMCNFNRARITCILVFISTALLTIPLALRYKTVKVYNFCEKKEFYEVIVGPLWRNEQFAIAYTWVHNSLRTLVPIIIVSALNYFIVKSLRESRKRRRNRTSLHRITVMLVSVIVVFVICVTPDAIISTIFRYGYYEANYLIRAIREITDLLLLINSATNFILYCIFNSVFRQNFVAMFCTMDGEKAYLFKRDVTAYQTTNASMAMGHHQQNGSQPQNPKIETVLIANAHNCLNIDTIKVEVVSDHNSASYIHDPPIANGKCYSSTSL